MFPLLNLLTSGIIMFILLLKQPSLGKLDFQNSKGGSLGVSRSFLNLRFDQRSYPRMFSRDIKLRPGRGCATSPAHTTFSLQHLCSLEGLQYCTLGLFLRMCLHTVDLVCDVSNNQWATSVLFDCLLDVLFGFLQMPLGIVSVFQARMSGPSMKERGRSLLNLVSWIFGHDRFEKAFCEGYLISESL